MKKIFMWIVITLLSLLLVIVLIGVLFVQFSPQFGGSVTKEQQAEYEKTGHYEDGKFINYQKILMKRDIGTLTKIILEVLSPNPNVVPKEDITVQEITPESILQHPDSLVRVTWFGHSTFLIEIEGKVLLIDPMFSQVASPHPWLGKNRFNSQMPINIHELPTVDAVIISHDHYDHLDYNSISQLAGKTNHFFAPLGVGNHLRSWNIPQQNITELDWWEETSLGSLLIALTPSRHFSGRGITDNAATLWGSWVIQGKNRNIFFSGDGGYGTHFAEIGKKYGPFDIGLMECGQYNVLWKDVHMMPEETVQASMDVGAKVMIPIHWGAFALASHSWKDPIERVTKKAHDMNINISTPQIGEAFILGNFPYPSSAWWENYQ